MPTSLVVKNGSKILGCTSSGTPGPSSLTSSTTASRSRSCQVRTMSVPRPCAPIIACSALMIRLSSTCWIWCGSANACGRPAASASMVTTLLTRCSYERSASVSRTTWLRSTIARVVWRLRAKVSRLRTILAARSDSLRMVSRPRRVWSSAGRCDSRSAHVRMVASGLFSSCATPEIVWPSAASFSAWRS